MISCSIIMLHKPKGYVVTRSDERNRKTVYDLLPQWTFDDSWMPVGRLDLDSRGLLLFVKDSALIEQLGAPGNFPKIYDVWIRGRITQTHIDSALNGIESPFGLLRCAEIRILGTAGPKTHLSVTLTEGKNRHLRRIFGSFRDPVHNTPLKVLELKRIAFGPIHLDLPSGQWRFLSDQETALLCSDASQS